MSAPNCRVAIPKGHTVPHETYEIICATLSVRVFLVARNAGQRPLHSTRCRRGSEFPGSRRPRHVLHQPAKPQQAEPRFAGCRAGNSRKARTVEVVLQTLQQLCDLIGVVHVGFPLADHTVFVDDNCGPFPV